MQCIKGVKEDPPGVICEYQIRAVRLLTTSITIRQYRRAMTLVGTPVFTRLNGIREIFLPNEVMRKVSQ